MSLDPPLSLNETEKNIPADALEPLTDILVELRAATIPMRAVEARAGFWHSLGSVAQRKYAETMEELAAKSRSLSA